MATTQTLRLLADEIIGYGDRTVRDIDDLHRLVVEEKVDIPMALTFLRRRVKRTI